MTSFFPSRTVALYMGRMFLVRTFGILAGLVLVLQALDLLGESGKILAVPGNTDAQVWQYMSLRVPQIIARLHSPSPPIRHAVHELLRRVARAHPHGLIYPLTVAAKAPEAETRTAAQRLLAQMRLSNDALVSEAELVSTELIHAALSWLEAWHAGLEEASRLYFGAHDAVAMLATLAPLHAQLDGGATTARERWFEGQYGRELREARGHTRAYEEGGGKGCLGAAWDVYYACYRRMAKHLSRLTSLELAHVPAARARLIDHERLQRGRRAPENVVKTLTDDRDEVSRHDDDADAREGVAKCRAFLSEARLPSRERRQGTRQWKTTARESSESTEERDDDDDVRDDARDEDDDRARDRAKKRATRTRRLTLEGDRGERCGRRRHARRARGRERDAVGDHG